MEKIKITREQEEALNHYKAEMERKDKNALLYRAECDLIINPWNKINEFTIEQFALLLCGWYEVEQPFMVGEWVYLQSWDRYCQAEEIKNGRLYYMSDGILDCDLFGEFTKVTEPWKVMLLELGREKPEFKIGDRYITCDKSNLTISGVWNFDCAYGQAKANEIKYFYPVESRIEVKA